MAPAVAVRPTFDELCDLEPRLRELERTTLARGREAYRKRNWCANAAWFGYDRFDGRGSLKDRLSRLVGWDREGDPVLGSEAAYAVAYDHLYRLIPDCRCCSCL